MNLSKNRIVALIKCKRCGHKIYKDYSKAGMCLSCYKEMRKLESKPDPVLMEALRRVFK